MEYLYHLVPKNMTGAVLYPLNTLKDEVPEAYSAHVKKYDGREVVMKVKMPILNCLWNDVLHLTAVEPQQTKANFLKAGIDLGPWQWFKIPVESLEQENLVVFLYQNDPGVKLLLNPRNYEKFDINKMDFYRNVPRETIEHYRERYQSGNKPFTFHLIPHILYKGSIDTTNLEIVVA